MNEERTQGDTVEIRQHKEEWSDVRGKYGWTEQAVSLNIMEQEED